MTIRNPGIGDGRARDAKEVEQAKEAEEKTESGRIVPRVRCPPCAPFVLSNIITLERSTAERVSNCPMGQNWYRGKKTVLEPACRCVFEVEYVYDPRSK